MKSRDAAIADAPAIARIYNEGIDDRVATFVEDQTDRWMTNASDGVRQPAA